MHNTEVNKYVICNKIKILEISIWICTGSIVKTNPCPVEYFAFSRVRQKWDVELQRELQEAKEDFDVNFEKKMKNFQDEMEKWKEMHSKEKKIIFMSEIKKKQNNPFFCR